MYSCSLPLTVFLSQLSIEEKIELICRKVYGAVGIEILPEARQKIELYTKQVLYSY